MGQTTEVGSTTLQIIRTYKAQREKVWNAWTNPEALKKWFGPSDEFTVLLAEVDLGIGGTYRLQMKAPNGEVHTAVGTYKEVNAHEKLVFTWSWEEGGGCGDAKAGPPIDTLVTLEFRVKGNESEMILTHDRFPNVEARDKHQEGWSGCLARLGKLF